ncbi:MAG: circadian clock KaiB family protein [Aggregatilineales bacterium]
MTRYSLTLYVAGFTPKSEKTISHVRRICQEAFGDEYDLRIVDVMQRPDLAEQHHILATPTLVREFPLPIRHIIGDLSAADKVREALDIDIAANDDYEG